MGKGDERARDEGAASRRVVYCLVPYELAPKLLDPLRRHFRDDPEIEVVVERRSRERRAADRTGDRQAADRRRAAVERSQSRERRRVRNVAGRRVGERRAALASVDPRQLPRRARPHADRIGFVEREEPAGEHREELDTARLVLRIQGGERELFADLYRRYFNRVYAYLRVLVRDAHEAEDLAQQVFTQVLENLSGYEFRGRPFKAWLFTIVRHQAIQLLRRSGRIDVVDPGDLNERRERERSEDTELSALDWLSDRDLVFLVERLPAPQRQVLTLRYLLDLPMSEIADVLDVSANHVSVLNYRAMGFLRERLAALGRRPEHRVRGPRMRTVTRHARVLRRRRYALSP